MESKVLFKNSTLFCLFVMLLIGFSTNAQTIASTAGTSNCAKCVPNTDWVNFAGTADVSNNTIAATTGTGGGGASWIQSPTNTTPLILPTPPNNHTHWPSLRDVGIAGTEETISTTLTGLIAGREYEIVAYSLTAVTGGNGTSGNHYSGTYNDFYTFQIGTGNINTIATISQNTWDANKLRFIAGASSEELYIRPGANSLATAFDRPGFILLESVQISITENAINAVPIADANSANTAINTVVTFNVTDTDSDPNGNIDVSTVDLDTSTPNIQNTITTAAGTWSVDNNANVTFNPTFGFIGTASLSYTVNDDYSLDGISAAATSNVATLTVFVLPDNDGDGVDDITDLDDDNDGILDIDEQDCTTETPIYNPIPNDGDLVANFILPSGITGTITSTNPTTGSYDSARPNYNQGSFGINTSRGGGGGASTTWTFDSSVLIDLEIRNILGNGANNESQEVLAFLNGQPVTYTATGTVGGTLVGNILIGGTATTAANQSDFVITTDGPIDEIRITSQGHQDYITTELISVTCASDFDNDGIPNYFDLDSDNDGIPDTVEAQPTDNYNAPGAIDPATGIPAIGTDTDGIDSPQNTDNTGNPDYLDTDSDDDGVFDIDETGNSALDNDNDGMTNDPVGSNGLTNTMDNGDDFTDPDGTLDNPTTLPNNQVTSTTEVDYREKPIDDNDNDGVDDVTDLDDDNDGILDIDEQDCTTETPIYNPIPNDGDLVANFILPSGITGTITSTNPTTGSYDSARPNYNQGSFGINTSRGGGGGASTTWTFDSSVLIDLEIRNILGNGANNESQEVLAFLNGQPVTYTATGTVGGTLVGNILIGGTATTAANQSDFVITTDGPIDEIRITSQGHQDYITTELISVTCASDFDNDGIPNYFDLDSDNDGIPDTVEAQPTDNYNAPGAIDPATGIPAIGTDTDGIDSPQNTDNTGNPDYLDTDSDDDGIFDIDESGLTTIGTDGDNDGMIDILTDVNNDGADDGINTSYTDADGNVNTPINDLKNTDTIPEDVDYRSVGCDLADLTADCDGDGVTNGDELNPPDGETATDPNEPCDFVTADITLTPDAAFLTADCDSDGVTNGDELNPPDGETATDPNEPCDFVTADITLTPDAAFLAADCDGDGVTNGDELNPPDGETATDPNEPCDFVTADITLTPDAAFLAADCDGDGVTNGDELNPTDGETATDPNEPCDFVTTDITLTPDAAWNTTDCDGDGITNGQEIIDNTDPLDACSSIGGTPLGTSDCDEDGLSGNEEAIIGTDPNNPDTDGDGILDGQEVLDDTNPLDDCQSIGGTPLGESDCDNDGLTNDEEEVIGTDPFNADTDGDLINDGQEVNVDSTDPLDPCDNIGGTPPAGSGCDISIYNDLVGPGIDDGYFRIINIEHFVNNTVKIYNRWGVLVYDTKGYDRGNNVFRGRSNGRSVISKNEDLPVGVYYYIINYNLNGQNKSKTGYIYLNR